MSPGLVIERRFRGPARSGNGGYTAGTLAGHAPAPGPDRPATVEVTLRRPPPLEVGLEVRAAGPHDAGVLLVERDPGTGGDLVVAEARPVARDLVPVEAVPPDVAAAAMAGFPGLRAHPFPSCFACGPDRGDGDGLRIFPGPVPGRDGTVASLWVPDASLAERGDLVDPGVERVGAGVTWSALDCVGGWSEDLEGRPMVLGRMTARLDALPVVGEPHVVVGSRRGGEGRKSFTAATLYDADGRVVATAEHVWIAVDPRAFE